MSSYKVPYHYDIHFDYIDESIEFNPEDYFNCSDECNLNDSAYDEVQDSCNIDNLEIGQVEIDFSLPKEFIDE